MSRLHSDPRQPVRAVTIRGHHLATCLTLSNTALVIKFDFTRVVPEAYRVGTDKVNRFVMPKILTIVTALSR